MCSEFGRLLAASRRRGSVSGIVPLLTMLGVVAPIGPLASCGSGGASSSLLGNAAIEVTGTTDLGAVGPIGGPFVPSSVVYTITNTGDEPVEWQCTPASTWILATPATGTLAISAAVQVTVGISASAAPATAGSYSSTVAFVNLANGVGDTSRPVTLSVTPLTGASMTTARRASGVAPLAVLFDAVGPQSGVVQPQGPDADWGAIHHQWDFGDPDSGTWTYSGKSKNRAAGFVAAHVYEQPGTYVAQLTVVTATGQTHEYTQQITVASPDAAMEQSTFYVSAAGNDANPGTSEQQAFRTAARGFTALFASSGARRLLFRRGDSFPASQSIGIGARTGPYLVGAYGSGAKPVVAVTHGNTALSYAQVEDLRIVDVDFDGPYPGAAGHGLVPGRDCLVLRSRISGFSYGMLMEESTGNDHSGNTIADCEIVDNGIYGVYHYSRRQHFAVLGTRFDNSVQNSLLRAYTAHSVWQSNRFQRAGQSATRVLGREQSNPASHVVVADNTFESTTPWVFEIGPENAESAQFAENILVEGNRFVNHGSSAAVVLVFAPKVTVRNNTFDLTEARAVQITQRGIGPVPARVRVHNNTAYRSGNGPLNFVSAVTADATDVSNNIVYSPGGNIVVALGSCSTANNLQTNPSFVDAPNGDFRLQASSAAVDAGRVLPVRRDFDGAERPKGGTLDIGAFERQD